MLAENPDIRADMSNRSALVHKKSTPIELVV